MFSCEICSKHFNRKDNMQRHINNIHNGTQRLVKGVMPTSSYIANQQMDEFENNQFGSGYIVDLAEDTHLSDLQTNMTNNIYYSCNMPFDSTHEWLCM